MKVDRRGDFNLSRWCDIFVFVSSTVFELFDMLEEPFAFSFLVLNVNTFSNVTHDLGN